MRFTKWMVPFRASEYPQIREKPLRSKSAASDGVPVRVRSPAPNKYNPNQIFRIGKGFGLFFISPVTSIHTLQTAGRYGPNRSPEGQERRSPNKQREQPRQGLLFSYSSIRLVPVPRLHILPGPLQLQKRPEHHQRCNG